MDRLKEVQQLLEKEGLDGWLLYDFRGQNPLALSVLGIVHTLLTRRWFVWVPTVGKPQALVHVIEKDNLPWTYPKRVYASRESLVEELSGLLGGARRVAMEYSPLGDNPYLSRVDAGTVDLLRSLGVEVVSSGNLLQLFAAWSSEQMAAHREAARQLGQVKDLVFAYIAEVLAKGKKVREFEIQEYMQALFREHGLETEHGPTVAFGPSSSLPHYRPRPKADRVLSQGEVILLDMWAKLPGPNPYADITWVAFWGRPSEEVVRAFTAVLEARDRCVDFLAEGLAEGREIRGWEVDAVARRVLEGYGFGSYIQHRTGHSLGVAQVHGDAVHFDGYETRDDRRVIPNLGYTVEPGVYLGDFGVRTEIDVLVHPASVEITSPVQRQIDAL